MGAKRRPEGIRIDRDGDVLRLTLDRPERRNAFDGDMVAALVGTVTDPPDGVRAIVLTGAGDAFCAGADLGWMVGPDPSPETARRSCGAISGLYAALDAAPVPLVARVNGLAVGGGVGLVAVCDLAVAADTATFQLSEVRVGLVPAMIGPYVARHVGAGRVREWALTAERLDASTARQWGLVGTVVPPERLDAAVAEKLGRLRAGAPRAIAAAKEFFRRIEGLPPAAAADAAVEAIVQRVAGDEARERVRRFAKPAKR